MSDTLNAVLAALSAGLPRLLLHFVVTLALLVVGVRLYMAITPFDERRLIETGNTAAGIVLASAVIGLAMPLAATLATSELVVDILLWGTVAIVLQLITFGVFAALLRSLRRQIETGNVAVASTLAAAQIAVGLLNAAAVSG
jgi:putative membrane protein